MILPRWVAMGILVIVAGGLSRASAAEIVEFAGQPQQLSLEQHKERFRNHLTMRIDELQRVCDLTDKQSKKLQVASKGAVEEVLEKLVKKFPQFRAGFRPAIVNVDAGVLALPAAEGPQVAPPRPERIDGGDEAQAAAFPAPQIVAQGQVLPAPAAPLIWQAAQPNVQMDSSRVANTVVWRNAVRQILTDQQHERYRDVQNDRRLQRRKIVADRVVTSLDRRLFMSAEQRKQLAQLIYDTVAANLDNLTQDSAFTSDATLAAQVITQVPRDKLAGILAPAQIKGLDEARHGLNNQVIWNIVR